ncbi:MAG: flavodoxin family protein [Promethearchaeota archaeon]
MKTLIIYFTMSGRTKKTAETIGRALINHDVSYLALELTGKFIEKIKKLDKFENNDFSAVEKELSTLDALNYNLVIIGMPTYGNFPPKVYSEIIKRIGNLDGKKIVVFNTARFSGGKCLEFMIKQVEENGGEVVEYSKFRKLLWIGTKKAIEFGKKLNKM